jgi:hypothetical protein
LSDEAWNSLKLPLHHLSMNDKTGMVSASNIPQFIRSICTQRVILDSDLAKIYGVETVP